VSLRGAILGFLSLEPTSGYTLKQRFDGSVRSFWSATQSQIYRELHALERQGLVEVEAVPGNGKPERKVYSLTTPGLTALQRWLEEPLDPLVLRHPMLLKLVFAAHAAPGALGSILEGYGRGVAQTRSEYAARLTDESIFSLARSAREGAIWRLSIEHGVAWCDAELRWIERARRILARAPKGKGKTWNRKAR
jgi:PadR family transcriptional regulator AphA